MFVGLGIIVLYLVLKPKSALATTPMPMPTPTPMPPIVQCPAGSIPCENNPSKCKQIGVDYIIDPCA